MDHNLDSISELSEINLIGGKKYPKISDDNFYDKINNVYKKFKITKNRSFDSICFPKQYELQLPQQFMSEYLNPDTPYKSILIYHRIGAGKSCTAIRIAESWKEKRNVVVVLPASLKGNFRDELRSLCAENNYLTKSERSKMLELYPASDEYKEIIARSDKRIDKYYKIYSYNKFIELAQNDDISLRNTILIIDEVQNMVSEDGSYYKILYDLIDRAPDELRIVLLSATPMFDKPAEIALTMNLLKIPNELPVGADFEKKFIKTVKRNGIIHQETKNLDYFKKAIKGYVSYFRGAPPYVFPELYVKYVKCEMSEFQYKAYKDVMKNDNSDFSSYRRILTSKELALKSLSVRNLPNDFFIGTRVVSNVVFPNRKIGEEGFVSFKKKKILENLEMYSTKFNKMMIKINKSKGKVFVYSGFKEFGGIKSFTRVLDAFGYKNYSEYGPGIKRYALWSGDENMNYKNEIKAVYNGLNNIKGRHIKILCGSPSIKEGVSLKAVRQVHVLEPYWNQSRLDQIIGRASRFCSHMDLSEEERIVKVYIYIATSIIDGEKTVDEYIQHLAAQKNKLIKEFETAIKEAAVDCELNKKANVYAGEEKIKCE